MKVWVTGGHGFLGKYVNFHLVQRGHEVGIPTHNEVDLLYPDQVISYLDKFQPEAIIHLAAMCGGIGANREHPAEFFYNNLMMGVQLIDAACWSNKPLKKFVTIGTVCSYPKYTPVPFKEEDIWKGYPEETNAPYGIAKKALLVQTQAYREQYNFPGIYLIPVNLYGPEDNFNPESSHVIPALIRKFDEAIKNNLPTVEVWGTGEATREFLFVDDCAEGIVDAMEMYDSPEPMNLGTGKSVAIHELVYLIRELMGYDGGIIWDRSKPDGQPARELDISKAQKEINWEPKTELHKGLQRTIKWWRKNGNN